MTHPIAHGLTGDEARECTSWLLNAIERHDESGDTRALLVEILAISRRARDLVCPARVVQP